MSRLDKSQWLELRKLYVEGRDASGKKITIAHLSKVFSITRKHIYNQIKKDLSLWESSDKKFGYHWELERENFANGIKATILRVNEEEIRKSLFKDQQSEYSSEEIKKSYTTQQLEEKTINKEYDKTRKAVSENQEKKSNYLATLKTSGLSIMMSAADSMQDDLNNEEKIEKMNISEKKKYVEAGSIIVQTVDKTAGLDRNSQFEGAETIANVLKKLGENL